MSLARETMRGRALKARLAVNGIQNASRSFGTAVATGLRADWVLMAELRDEGFGLGDIARMSFASRKWRLTMRACVSVLRERPLSSPPLKGGGRIARDPGGVCGD